MSFNPILSLFIVTVSMGILFGLWSLVRTSRAYDAHEDDSPADARALEERAERLTN